MTENEMQPLVLSHALLAASAQLSKVWFVHETSFWSL
jgi:hypothetical protein